MKLWALVLGAALILIGCNGKSDTPVADPPDPTTTATTGGKAPGDTGTTEKSTDTGSDATTGKTGGAEHPTNATTSTGSTTTGTASTGGKTTGSTGTTATPTRSTYVGQYKMTQGLGANAVMYMLDLKDNGTCELKAMSASSSESKDPVPGKWNESGGQVLIELKGQSPLVATLKDREMISQQFDKAHWKGNRLVFYKR